MLKLFFPPIYNDVAEPWQIGFQDSAAPGFDGIVQLHDSIFFFLVLISVGVFWMLFVIIRNFSSTKNSIVYKYLNHGTLIELIWTITPAFILVAIAFPSFKLLYALDEVIDPAVTIKVNGHQWFWSYEYSDMIDDNGETIDFDSYMLPDADLQLGEFRLLEVDNKLVVPSETHIRFIVTGTDVIHDWAIPSLGIKIDAVPGRLNQTSALIDREGFFYGQCSEICGVWHGFMPIVVRSVNLEDFFNWAESYYCAYN
jgi:cytochrome c oxidase subunit 2